MEMNAGPESDALVDPEPRPEQPAVLGQGRTALADVDAAWVAHARPVSEPRLAPDASAVAWAGAANGRGDLWVLELDASGAAVGAPVPITTDPTLPSSVHHGGGLFVWSPDGAELAFRNRDGVWRITRTGGRAFQCAGPGGWSLAAWTDVGIVAADSGATADTIAIIDPDAGPRTAPRRIAASADFRLDPTVAADGAVAWHEWDVPAMPWDGGRIVELAPGADAVEVVDGGAEVSVGQPRYAPTGDALAWISDRSGFAGLWIRDRRGAPARPLWTPSSDLAAPTWGPGQRSWVWSPDASRILVAEWCDAATRLVLIDVASGASREVAAGSDGVWQWLDWRGPHAVGTFGSVDVPTAVCRFDPDAGAQPARMLSAPAAAVAPGTPEVRRLRWPSGDAGGTMLHALLIRPASVTTASAAPPLIVWPHGGPTDAAVLRWNPRARFLLDRGYALLFVNHRGSTGYGRAYVQAMRHGWGIIDADDTASGIRHVVSLGLVDPDRIAIMGSSAGGFCALRVLARDPGLCRAGIVLYAVTDLAALAEATHRFEAHATLHLVGDPVADAAEYVARSPLHDATAGRLTVPLLVLQGDADPVVPPAQADALVAALAACGTPHEAVTYAGEGHGWGNPVTVRDELDRIETFLAAYLAPTASPIGSPEAAEGSAT